MTSTNSNLPTNGSGIVGTLWASKAWRLLAILLVYISGLMLMVPVLPGLVTDDFASRRAGKHLKCDDIAPSLMPDACINAHADAVWWSTATSFFQNTLFSVLLASCLLWMYSVWYSFFFFFLFKDQRKFGVLMLTIMYFLCMYCL